MNGLTMRFDNMFADGQPQTSASFIPASGGIGPVKSLKYSVNVVFVNPDAIIRNLYQHVFPVCIINAGDNIAVEFAILTGIFDEVKQHHSYFLLVCKNRDRIFTTFLNAGM